MKQHRQSTRYNSRLAALARMRDARIDRALTAHESARIRYLWASDPRPPKTEIARLVGVSVYAVQQAIAGRTPNLYRGTGAIDPIEYARAACRAQIAAIYGRPV